MSPRASTHPGPTTVLLVEDDETLAALARLILEGAQMNVVIAGTGRTAMQVLDTGCAIDVAILDLGLPDRDGATVAGWISNSRPEIAVVISTGSLRQGEGHFDAYLPKPYTGVALLAAVQRALAKHALHVRPTVPH